MEKTANQLLAEAAMLIYSNAMFLPTSAVDFAGDIKEFLKREAVKEQIEACKTADGKVWIEEHGMDCDRSQYSGKMTQIDATIEAYEAHFNSVAEWADGPFGFTIMPEEQAKKTRHKSRDLAAEQAGY